MYDLKVDTQHGPDRADLYLPVVKLGEIPVLRVSRLVLICDRKSVCSRADEEQVWQESSIFRE